MQRRGWRQRAGGLLALALWLGGCVSSGSGTPGPLVLPPPAAPDTEYAIQPGDTLGIRFYYHPDHDQKMVLVANDGRIMLPLVGAVEAAGLKPSELATRLETRYSSNLRDPAIAVSITQVYQDLVWVGGEVYKPGFVQYRPGLTAVQALVAVGGPRNTAAINECLLLRRIGRDGYESSRLDLTKAIESGETETDPMLGPQDVIFIPKTAVAKANMWVRQYIINMIPVRFTDRLDRQVKSDGEPDRSEQTKPSPAAKGIKPSEEPK
ncbi:MAG TPA: polysaccharide biosynthesis/export family protein [Methylomirabilota bacterium]|nr:polysaccharide biosynthesis/export family protein [Methylomirabilota bacterium]